MFPNPMSPEFCCNIDMVQVEKLQKRHENMDHSALYQLF